MQTSDDLENSNKLDETKPELEIKKDYIDRCAGFMAGVIVGKSVGGSFNFAAQLVNSPETSAFVSSTGDFMSVGAALVTYKITSLCTSVYRNFDITN